MNLKFKLSETGLDGIVQAIRAVDSDHSIHVFIDGDNVEVTSKPRGDKSPDKAMQEFYESEDGREFKMGVGPKILDEFVRTAAEIILNGARKAQEKMEQQQGMCTHPTTRRMKLGWAGHKAPRMGCRCASCVEARNLRGF